MKIFPWICICAGLSFGSFADDWKQWRGPEFNGSSPEKGLPGKWTKEEVVWAAPLPGPGAATPVVLGDRVFVSAADEKAKTLHAICIDRKSGKILWDNIAGEGGVARDDKSNFAAPSPVADDHRVYFFYSNGIFVAYDLSGKKIWSRDITKDYGDFAFQWTFSSSPMLSGGKLYLQVLQRDVAVRGHGKTDAPNESYLLKIDPATGMTIWKHARASDAVSESLEAYSTPIPFEFQGRKEILVAGGDCVTGHDPDSGEELWRWGTWNPRKISHWRFVPSPVAGGGVVLVCAPKGDPIYAVKAGGKGKLNDSAIAWRSDQTRELSSDVPTPIFYEGDFFILSDVRKSLSRVDPATGKVKWTVETPGRKKYESTPTAADHKIYMMNFAGEVAVIDTEKGSVISTIAMGEEGDDMTRSAIAIAHGQLFVRANQKLYCIGSK